MLREIVVKNASAGGVAALQKVVERPPADLPAAVFVVLHMSPNLSTKLPEVLSRAGSLPAGLRHLKREGGLVIVQDPEDAAFSGMPEAALATVKADHCVPVSAIGDLVARACVGPSPLLTEAEAVRPIAAMQ